MRAPGIGSVVLSVASPTLWIAAVVSAGVLMKARLAAGPEASLVAGADPLSLSITAIFFWIVLFDLFPRALRLTKDARAVRGLAETMRDDQPIDEALVLSHRGDTRVGRRLKVIDGAAANAQDPAELVPAIAGLEEAGVEPSYALTKAFIWILPVVGFIGTARGMAQAIQGFSGALPAPGVDKIDLPGLVSTLGGVVVPGLAHAFAITMLALSASLIAHVVTTIIQRWDQSIARELDILSVRLVAPKQTPALSAMDPRAVVAVLKPIADSLAILAGGDPSRRLATAADGLSSSAQEVQRTMQALRTSLDLPYQVRITRGPAT